MSSDVYTNSINPAGSDFISKYTPLKGKEANQQEMRPPSRHKTPTKAVGLENLPETPRTPPDSRQLKVASKVDDNIETIVSLEPKGDLLRRKNINKAKRADDNQWNNFMENRQAVEYEARSTHTHGPKAFKEYDLIEEWEPKDSNYQGAQWFFENSRREEHTKDDSFVQIEFNNVYEMDGVAPSKETEKFVSEEDETCKRGKTSFYKVDDIDHNSRQPNEWLSNPASGSPSSNNKGLNALKMIEGGPPMKVSLG